MQILRSQLSSGATVGHEREQTRNESDGVGATAAMNVPPRREGRVGGRDRARAGFLVVSAGWPG